MSNPKEIGKILKEARQKRALNVEAVYKATRIQPSLIELFEQGRADEALSRVYVISFLKKYAFFLNMDGDALAAEYKKFYKSEEKQLLDLNEKLPAASADAQKWMVFAVYAGLALLLAFFILLLGVKMRSAKATHKTPKVASEKAAPRAVPKEAPLFPIPEEKSIELTLEGTDDVWMKVKKDGKTAFEGTLGKNEKKNFSAKKKIELWVGRAEALKFAINGRPVGKVGEGRIRDIAISRSGLKVNDKWLLKAE